MIGLLRSCSRYKNLNQLVSKRILDSNLPFCKSAAQTPALLHGGGPCWCWCSQTFSQDLNHTRRRESGHLVLRLAKDLAAIVPLSGLKTPDSPSRSCRRRREGRGLRLYYGSVKSTQGRITRSFFSFQARFEHTQLSDLSPLR